MIGRTVSCAGIFCIVILFSAAGAAFPGQDIRESVGDETNIMQDERVVMLLNELKEKNSDGVLDKKEVEELLELSKELFGDENVHVNGLCKVTGIGGGLVIPPYLPITPVLIAVGAILLDTEGTNGHWCHTVHLAIMIPFVGGPIFIPPYYVIIAGFAGAVIGIVLS